MKVGKIIEILQQCDPDLDIRVQTANKIPITFEIIRISEHAICNTEHKFILFQLG